MSDICKQIYLGEDTGLVFTVIGETLFSFRLKTVPGDSSKYEEKSKVTVDEGDLGKLRIYFDGSSLEKVFSLASKMSGSFSLSTFSCLIPLL